MAEEYTGCYGESAAGGELGKCRVRPRFEVSRPAGKEFVKRRACGRHLSWLVDYMTVPGRSVTVTKLSNRAA